MKTFKRHEREPTDEERIFGRGEVSGETGGWRVMDIETDASLRVFYPAASYRVENVSDWAALPEEGLQIIVAHGGIWKGCDEYRYHGSHPKRGLYIDDAEFEAIRRQALG